MATQSVSVVVSPAISAPLIGVATGAAGNSNPFTPQLGRDMYLTLTGTWTGSIRVQRTTDNGSTWNNVTIGGGQTWGLFSGNADEVIDTPTDGAAKYRLSWTGFTGTASYRLAQ